VDSINEDRLIGPPGCGKTTTLAQAIAHNASVYDGGRVIAVSHTRAAAAELVGRDPPIPLDNIGTIHSFAFHALDRPSVAEESKLLAEFASESGYSMSAQRKVEDLEGRTLVEHGDSLLSEYSRLRNARVPRVAWSPTVTHFAVKWEDFKRQTSTVDFTDMIELALLEVACPVQEPVVICVDEAQDTSKLQWALVRKWASHPTCEKLVTAGDPDQSIFEWAGADPSFFVENAPRRRLVLEQSYRVPREVHAFAQRWIRQVVGRDDVVYRPRDFDGACVRRTHRWGRPWEFVDELAATVDAGRSVMVMASCAYMLTPLVEQLRDAGVAFRNPWRKTNGAWNPLRTGGRGTSTAEVFEALMAPWMPDAERMWTPGQVATWASRTTKAFKRGGKERLSNLEDDLTDGQIIEVLMRYAATEDDLSAILDPPPRCSDWLADHLEANRRRQGAFLARLVARRGPQALSEEPRLYVGTCHSFKGSEADVVYVFPDLSWLGFNEYVGEGRDSVTRLFYVAATRAREELHLCSPTSRLAVNITM
jgi:superfamily I DNA/RNA helicase